jgi:hypothetical protein
MEAGELEDALRLFDEALVIDAEHVPAIRAPRLVRPGPATVLERDLGV